MISQYTFQFLTDLAIHNDRDWFQLNKNRYQVAKQEVLSFAEVLIAQLQKYDDTLPANLDAKKCLFRIYRDTRFSKDKTPYKTNMAIWIDHPGYYVHIEPHRSFVGGGMFMPDAQQLKLIRQEIDYNGGLLADLFAQVDFQKNYHQFHQTHQLQNPPKGYVSNHQFIDWLKLKSFTVSSPIEENVFFEPNALHVIVEKLLLIKPLNTFLKQAIS